MGLLGPPLFACFLESRLFAIGEDGGGPGIESSRSRSISLLSVSPNNVSPNKSLKLCGSSSFGTLSSFDILSKKKNLLFLTHVQKKIVEHSIQCCREVQTRTSEKKISQKTKRNRSHSTPRERERETKIITHTENEGY